MEKQIYDLEINPELRDFLPAKSSEESEMLEETIVREGCRNPIVVWNGVIVDGHNRYEICHRHQIPFAIEEQSFSDIDAVKCWMLEHQLSQRNVSPIQKVELVRKYAPLLRKEAAKRQATSTGGTVPQLVPNLAQADQTKKKNGRTRERLADMAGISHGTYDKLEYILDNGDDDMKQKVINKDLSVHKAYTNLLNSNRAGEKRTCAKCGVEKPLSEFPFPAHSKDYSTICQECKKADKKPARKTDPDEAEPFNPAAPFAELPEEVTGIVRVGRGYKHDSTGIPDDPSQFPYVIDLVSNALNACLASFRASVNEYRPTMVSKKNTQAIYQALDWFYDQAESALKNHLSEIAKEDK